MGAAVLWDKEWNRYENIEDFHTMFCEPRGFDEMDEYITEILVGIPLESEEAKKFEDMVRSVAERALSLIRKEQVEAQSVMAFHVFARTTKVMFVNFGEKEAMHSLQIIGELRKAGISAELFPSCDKMKKQMGYANNKAIPFVAIIGEQEMTDSTVTLKNMTTGEQKTVTAEELKELLA